MEEKDIKFQFDPALRGVYEDNLRIREVGGQAMISFVKRDFKNEKQRGKYRLIDSGILSRAGHVKPCLNPPGPSGKAKYS